uniref:Integrase catalytic domain-containing protein n=1 Tax=Strongyloides papillosus TaxID=174720 RepID=A0A0N5BHP1_STREA
MRRTIAMKFIVEGYTRKTKKFLVNCKECQTAQKNLNKLISSLPKATFSSERIHIDNMVYGKSKICVIYDSFSRLTKAFFIKSYASKEMIKCVEKWIEEVGTISILVSDNHRPLISSEFDDWLKDHNIYHIRSIPYRSISNGLVERAQTITKINSSIGADKLTNCQRFEMGKANDTSVSFHDKYTVQVTALNGSGWYKVKYDDDDWEECE